jgi:DNA replication protein DnaC
MAMESAEELFARAAAGCIEAQWEANLQRDATTATQSTRTDNGLVKVPLKPLRERNIHRNVFRSMSLVDERLRECFRELVAGKRPWPLYLHGPAGTGKTRAILALCDFVADASYTTLQEACDTVMAGGQRAWKAPLFGNVPALFAMDEIGTRFKVGDLEFSTILEAWEHRERRALGVAIWCSNLTPGDLNRTYDNRVASRLLSGTVFLLDGPDRRLQRKHEGEPNDLPQDPRHPLRSKGADEYAN